MRALGVFTTILIVIFLTGTIFAHGEEHDEHATVWEKLKIPDPLEILYIASFVSGLAIVIALMTKHKLSEFGQKTIFAFIVIPIALATVYLSGTTVYLNMISKTGGPVHWHADYEIWACGSRYELIDPTGWDNKIGSPLFHEHNDNRMHIEGVVFDHAEVNLKRFFYESGSKLAMNELTMRTTESLKTWKNGEMCDSERAVLQVFLYKVVNPEKTGARTFRQEKLTDFENYVVSPYSLVPPGDCLIIEFGKEKTKTDKICETYEIAIEKGELIEEGKNGS